MLPVMLYQEKIILAVVCNNHFAVLLAALLKSIEITHQSNELIDLYIVNDELSAINVIQLNKCITSEKIRLRWIKMVDAFPAGIELPLDNTSFPVSTYIRLFTPYFVDKGTKRIIYLDVDMVLMEDISILWKVDLHNYAVGAVTDRAETIGNPWGGIKNYKELNLDPKAGYFNAGLLVINVENWLAMDITNKVINCINANKNQVTFADQYGLNVVLANDQWCKLDPLWNCSSMSSQKSPFLIHFTGVKPIYKNYNSNEDYKKTFFLYLEQSGWAGHQQQSGYARLYHKLLNVVSKKIAYLSRKKNNFTS